MALAELPLTRPVGPDAVLIVEPEQAPDPGALPDHVLEAAADAAAVDTDTLALAVRMALGIGPDRVWPEWRSEAACRPQPGRPVLTEAFYPERGRVDSMIDTCQSCPVQTFCLASALGNGESIGIWGGTSANGRRKLRKVLREAGVLGVVGEAAHLAWVEEGADREPPARLSLVPTITGPRPHQADAVAAVVAEIRDGGSCQIAMATASGKTHVALWSAEAIGAEKVLVMVPNLALVAQTAELWSAAAAVTPRMVGVCSDTGELDLENTTDPERLQELFNEPGPLVAFATYQSSPVLADAGCRWDLVVADEAHHLAGAADKHFAAVVRGEIPTERTLYMTATPRRFRRRAGDGEIVSMDDPAFGPRVYELNLSDAVEAGIVADYRVIVAAVDRDTFNRVAAHPDLGRVDPHLLAGAIAVVRAMGQLELGSCVSFHTRIERARTFAELVGVVATALTTSHTDRPPQPGWSGYLHGGSSMRIRQRLLSRLVDDHTWGVVANARTLGEGVDVPTLDAIAIVDPKTSETDVLQAVGRALRRSGTTTAKVGTVLLPVLLSDDADPDDALAGCDERSVEVVASVLRALRAHDNDLSSRLDRTRRQLGRRGGNKGIPHIRARQRRAARGLLASRVQLWVPGGATGALAGALSLRLVRDATVSWEETFGRLQAYVDEHGHARPAQSEEVYVSDEAKTMTLGAWCSRQRTLHSRGLLDAARVAQLDRLPGWSWNLRDAMWWEKFEVLKDYVERHGSIPAHSGKALWRGIDVGQFVNVVRSAIDPQGKDKGWLSKFPDRVKAVEALPGWVWNARDAEWEANFSRLERWVKMTGHADPRSGDAVDGFDIGRWVTKQRSRIRGTEYFDSRAGRMREESLSPERTARLRALPGWVDHTREAGWEDGFEHLVAWIERHGRVAKHEQIDDDGFGLGRWIATQRTRWRGGRITDERKARLEAIPEWTWEPPIGGAPLPHIKNRPEPGAPACVDCGRLHPTVASALACRPSRKVTS